MTEWHEKSKRKPSGGRLRTSRRSKKKLAWKGGVFSATKINPEKHEAVGQIGLGNTEKLRLKEAKFANVLDSKTQKTQKLEIANVAENLSNREFARRNIITQGAVIEVKKGSELLKARVSSRPGQNGIINAVLIK